MTTSKDIEAFQKWFMEEYADPNVGMVETSVQWHAAWAAWQAKPAPQPQQAAPAGYVLAPEYRGYALLGSGNYRIDHSAEGAPAELVISIATEADKLGRAVGDERDNPHGDAIQPEQMAVRICFQNVAGLDALEKQLCYLRNVHFPAATPPQQAKPAPQPVGLTWDQFVAACEAEYGEDFEPQVVSQATEEEKTQMLRVVRMVERAHGIPAPQATSKESGNV